ncbi:hypothetical protein [Lentzea sp. NBRC 105346]|uniref:golvesin C-terminal-like domain-containing protein n=1 Tax=Lentzea sp. NBRC 105346 TaxID=3032205 RepID=UPI00255660B7|nr:hypothetical protein [Lentzea sp. NBRC 105346]
MVYAPRTFTNKEQLFSRGGFTAVVDLGTGAVQRLPVTTSLAYFNPGCGIGEIVALTQGGEEDLGKTGLMTVDAGTGRLSQRTELDGQLTSAVPLGESFAVAGGTGVLKVSRDGKKERLARTKGTPSHLAPDAEGGVVYIARENGSVSVQRATGVDRPVTTLATGKQGKLGVTPGTAGKVFITGEPEQVNGLPQSVKKVDLPINALMSTKGEAAITELRPTGSPTKAEPQAWHIKAKSLRTGRDLGFTVNAVEALKPREVEPGYTCAVPRNDPAIQVLQPKPKQVEWAVDMAIYGYLFNQRPAGWRGNGLSVGYKPQELFPRAQLQGGGHVPAQVMLGIIGQESNMWQASKYTLPGETGNPLIGNYYGLEQYDDDISNDWDINFAKADCGYGVTQMTDGMRKAGSERENEVALDRTRQVAIATDYAANVAAGLQLLTTKWNELQAAGVKLHDGDPANIENWFFAAWAYNSGYHRPGEQNANGAYGLGWGNNPANPRYNPDRGSFGEDPRDFARPQLWPYPEKVMGFAANTPWGLEDENTEVPFFRPALWNGGDGSASTPGTGAYNRRNVKPGVFTFCTNDNNCEPGARYTPNDPEVDDDPAADTGPCAHKNAVGQYDLRCWWHTSTKWKPDNCAETCGYQFIRYDYPAYAAEPANGNSFPSDCSDPQNRPRGLPSPSSALVVDYWADSWRGCLPLATSGTMTFPTDGKPAAWVDLHQIGSGAGGHFWLTTTRAEGTWDAKSSVRAEWQLNQKLRTRAQVLAYIPAHGSNKATRAIYKIETEQGVQEVEADQTKVRNGWLNLGTFAFNNAPKVSLSSITPNGISNQLVAFDAIAFNPVTQYHPVDPDPTWRVTRIVNDQTGKCVYPASNGSSGVQVVQTTCLNNFSDDWIIKKVGTQPVSWTEFYLIHRATGSCIAVKNDSLVNNAPTELRGCADKTKWLNSGPLSERPFESVPLYSSPPYYTLSVLDNRTEDETPLVLRTDSPEGQPDPYARWDL